MVFEVVEVGQGKDWSSTDGARRLTFYPVALRDEQGQVQRCEWARKQGGEPPRSGEHVVGHVDTTPQGFRFKMDFEATKGLRDQQRAEQYLPQQPQVQQSQPGFQQPAYIPPTPPIQGGPTTPDGQLSKDNHIARMAAHKMGLGYFQILAQANLLPQNFKPSDIANAADFFETDAKR